MPANSSFGAFSLRNEWAILDMIFEVFFMRLDKEYTNYIHMRVGFKKKLTWVHTFLVKIQYWSLLSGLDIDHDGISVVGGCWVITTPWIHVPLSLSHSFFIFLFLFSLLLTIYKDPRRIWTPQSVIPRLRWATYLSFYSTSYLLYLVFIYFLSRYTLIWVHYTETECSSICYLGFRSLQVMGL